MLTDLPNRELLSDTIASWGGQADAGGQEISLLFIDLDRFEMIKDHWGHQVGDELLCAVARGSAPTYAAVIWSAGSVGTSS
nr:hypothetical protein Ade03nite_34510 [Actinoplanes derwentensis]